MFDQYPKTQIMGVINLTPDSFSGDGIYKNITLALEKAENMIRDGADIIDVGGESTRPGSSYVPQDEEIERVIPFIRKLSKRINAPISIDTSKSEVARLALDNGAAIVNDVSGLTRDEKMMDVISSYGAKAVIMHMKGEPKTMQYGPKYNNVVSEVIEKLRSLIEMGEARGIKKENIIIDPGIGFGKTLDHNLEILNNLSKFKVFELPILVGVSRKSFIGNVLGLEPEDRLFGTAAAVALAINNGASIVRVHDVLEMAQVARLSDAILARGEKINVR